MTSRAHPCLSLVSRAPACVWRPVPRVCEALRLTHRRLRDHSSSTLCELCAIIDAVSLVCQRGVNVAIISESKPDLQFLSSVQPTHPQVVQLILSFLSLMNARRMCVKFVWVPSHVGLCHNATADRLAKQACHLPPTGDERPLSVQPLDQTDALVS